MKVIPELALRWEARMLCRLARYYRREARRFDADGLKRVADESRRVAFAYRHAFRGLLSVLKNAVVGAA